MKNLTDEQITGASAPLILSKGEETLELQMSPLRDIDFSSLNLWLRQRVINFAYQNLPPKSAETLDLREEIIAVATKQAAAISWHSVDGIKILSTAEGMARVVWQCCHESYKAVLTYEELIPYFNDPENIQAYGRVFRAVNPHLVDKTNGAVAKDADVIEFPELKEIPKKEKKGSSRKKAKKQRSIEF